MTYRNLVEMHRRQAERLGPKPALLYKRHGLYHDLGWDVYRAEVLACAAALVDAGVRPGDRVGLLSENRVEWLIADLAIMAAGAVNVPPHAPLTARQVHFQLDDSGVRWLFVSTREQLEKVEQVWSELPRLEGIALFDRQPVSPSGRRPVIPWLGFLQRGRRNPHRQELARREMALGPEDLATIMYTSGTTGNPKGVMLTHGNLVSNTCSVLTIEAHRPDDVRLSWLPYSHIYARTVDHYESIASGIVMALAESAETLVQNLAEVEPTHMNSVPRFYEKVLAAVASPDPAEIGRRLRAVFGPRIDWLASGGAPLPRPVAEAFQAARLPLLQGYGLTESSPVISFNHKQKQRIDTVGPPIPGVEVRIAPDGEVLTRGPHVMKGYWNNPQATADALRDGWLYTGDLGQIDADGFLKITGRKKELLVLSNGKKVVPSFIEGLLLSEPCIDQAVVCGEGRNFLTALVVPNWPNVRQNLKAEGLAVELQAEEALANHPAVQNHLRKRIETALKEVSSGEQVKKFVILLQPLTVASGELTVSLKLRRQVVVEKYRSELDALYRD